MTLNCIQIYDQDMPSPMPQGLARLLVLEHISLGGSYWNFEGPRSRKLEGNERSPWSLAAMVLSLDAACVTSWYDSGVLRIPYGGRWKAKSIEKLLQNMVRLVFFAARKSSTTYLFLAPRKRVSTISRASTDKAIALCLDTLLVTIIVSFMVP